MGKKIDVLYVINGRQRMLIVDLDKIDISEDEWGGMSLLDKDRIMSECLLEHLKFRFKEER